MSLLTLYLNRYTPDWRMSDAMLFTVLPHILEEFSPRSVLELGPGASSLVLLPWCVEHGREYWALDHEGPFHEKHLATLRDAGLPTETTRAEPLDPQNYWYARMPLELARPFDLVVVDGPVSGRNTLQAHEFYQRWDSPETVWVFDDTHREAEWKAVCRVLKAVPGRAGWDANDPNYPRKTTILIP